MKKTPLYLLAVLLFLIVFTNCKKSDVADPISSSNHNTLSILEAKSWFTTNMDSTAKDHTYFANPLPNWENAISSQDKNWYVVQSPVTFNNVVGFSIQKTSSIKETPMSSRTDLLVLKNKKSNKIISALMHVVSNSGVNIQQVGYSQRSNFNGVIFYTTTQGSFINGWVYEAGKIKGRITSSSKIDADSTSPARSQECTAEIINWYKTECVHYNDGSAECSDWEYTHSEFKRICPDYEGDIDGGVGGVPPPEDGDVDDQGRTMQELTDLSLGTIEGVASVNISITSPSSSIVPFSWVVVNNKNNFWKVTSYDECEGYKDGNIVVLYKMKHKSSSISGQTSIGFKSRRSSPITPAIPISLITWSETSYYTTVAANYRSGIVKVAGDLSNFGYKYRSLNQSCTINVH